LLRLLTFDLRLLLRLRELLLFVDNFLVCLLDLLLLVSRFLLRLLCVFEGILGLALRFFDRLLSRALTAFLG
jgi:hypothetical protein